MILWIDDAARTEALLSILTVWSVVVGIDLIITVTYFIWPRQAKGSS